MQFFSQKKLFEMPFGILATMLFAFAASAWTTCATARPETSFETAPEAFRHEPVDDRVQTAEIVIKIILFLMFFCWKSLNQVMYP